MIVGKKTRRVLKSLLYRHYTNKRIISGISEGNRGRISIDGERGDLLS